MPNPYRPKEVYVAELRNIGQTLVLDTSWDEFHTRQRPADYYPTLVGTEIDIMFFIDSKPLFWAGYYLAHAYFD